MELSMNLQSAKKAIFIVAPLNFNEDELFRTKAVLDRSLIKTIVSSDGVNIAKGSSKEIAINVDITELKPEDYDAVVFIGGYGAAIFLNDDLLLDIAKRAKEAGKVVAAIGLASSILANSGILMGVSATSASSEEPTLRARGALFMGNPLIIDEKIITASGADAASDFGEAIARALR